MTDWAAHHGLDPHGADQWDDLLVEFKGDNVGDLTTAKFGQVVAAVELFSRAFGANSPGHMLYYAAGRLLSPAAILFRSAERRASF